jgi:signal transduction histidine kinase/phage shock protein PspC (stress-responsive transcriptional regulator)
VPADAPPSAPLPPPPVGPPPPPPPPRPSAPRFRVQRSRDDRVVGGVAGGLGAAIGVDPILVRIGFVVLAFAGGVGVLAYAALWALAPIEPERPQGSTLPPRPTTQQAVALGLITLGVLLLLRRLGLWFGDALVWPVVLGAAGSAVVWTRGDDGAPSGATPAWLARAASRRGPLGAVARVLTGPVSPVRIAAGTILVGVAVAGFLAGNDGLVALRDLGLAVVAAAAGVALLFGPWVARVAHDLGQERRERVRQEERAELAAHLHDSVLQTLALIQRSADDPRRIATLARVQERELRAWLYGSGRASSTAAPVTLTDAVEQVAAEVETLHHLAVDVVVVGDAPVDDGVRALLGAVREAATNAAKHAQVDEVSVYVEVVPAERRLVAFVRDRGVGFDVDEVLGPRRGRDGGRARPGGADAVDHRRGLRDSVLGRLERHGGDVELWSTPGEGTEIELRLPLASPASSPSPSPDSLGSPAPEVRP